MSESHEVLAERLLLAGDLSDFGIAMKSYQIQRLNPGISEEELDRRMAEWRHHSGGSELGDADGSVVPWPRQ